MPAITLNSKLQTVNCSIPQSWNDLTPHQAAQCALILRTDLPKHEQQLRLFLILLNIKWYHFRQYITLWRIGKEARFNLANEGTAFLYGENTLTNNPFPALSAGATPLLSKEGKGVVSSDIGNLTGSQFSAAEDALQLYHTTGDITHLHAMICALYGISAGQTPLLHKEGQGVVPLATAYAILQWYLAARAPYLKLLEHHFPQKETQKREISGWIKIFYSLAENVTSVSEVETLKLDRIIGYLIHLKEDAEAAKKPKGKSAVSFEESETAQ